MISLTMADGSSVTGVGTGRLIRKLISSCLDKEGWWLENSHFRGGEK